jgi:translation initiation factor 2 beta subunit (eIF-2beta)/eIF-5
MINIDFNDKLTSDPFARYKRHKIQIKQEGSGNGKVTILVNLSQLAKELNRTEKVIGSFLAKSLATQFGHKTQKIFTQWSFHFR